ncbi:MAG: pantoate--beta-alanine ligase [Deltaproteobacteria bacterium]|nr:pantoate--beta-alanine ligase [Candidatus Anaeroferrophillus wilburensis]MBN2890103.1 pantoate--beta-alanine ligase [Deltaproteobacteria bacterium]
MKIFEHPDQMQRYALAQRANGKTIAVVPTMGYLHQGHVSLMEKARAATDLVIATIFVNPMQFGPREDLATYPRNLEGDKKTCEQAGVDVIFTPPMEAMYPPAFQTSVAVSGVTTGLCGARRPGHFTGVTTVVAKLFNLTMPHKAFFGEKDYQQLVTIKRMVADLNFPIEIIGVPIVREADGLAMSSRNTYLSAAERHAALSLSQGLFRAQEAFQKGERHTATLKQIIEKTIDKTPGTLCQLEYLAICNPETLEELENTGDRALIALAAQVGTTRLIDNIILR